MKYVELCVVQERTQTIVFEVPDDFDHVGGFDCDEEAIKEMASNIAMWDTGDTTVTVTDTWHGDVNPVGVIVVPLGTLDRYR